MTQAVSGRLAEAEASLADPTLSGEEQGREACRGHILSNLARMMGVYGQITEAERLAEQSVQILEKVYHPDDSALLRPLQILTAARMESGETARARQAVKKLQSIWIEGPEDSAIVHATVGALRHLEGRHSEAEAEYNASFRAFEEAGRGESADAAAILHHLASLYLQERRLDEARRTLNRALVIHNRARDVVPMDRIKYLHIRGVLHVRLGEWQEAEQDLSAAVSMLDRERSADPIILRMLLEQYSHMLRRNHHRREVRSIEARIAALPVDRTNLTVVDVSTMRARTKPTR